MDKIVFFLLILILFGVVWEVWEITRYNELKIIYDRFNNSSFRIPTNWSALEKAISSGAFNWSENTTNIII